MATNSPALVVRAGAAALREIRAAGLNADRVRIMPGASGGPKWLVLAGIDRVLWGEFFRARREPLDIIGSSAGSWRFACAPQPDPLAALQRLEDAYIEQCYPPKPSPAVVTETAERILAHVLGPDGDGHIVRHPWLRTHIVTTRCRALTGREHRLAQSLGFALAAVTNLVSRSTLGWAHERVIFHGAGTQTPFGQLNDLPTRHVALREDNVRPALLASGSIPLVLAGVRDIPGAPRGSYRDGGIMDYHFAIDYQLDDGLILYPHFYPYLVPGWFDKALRWRRMSADRLERVVMLTPSPEFVASLPYAKIPDRDDFRRLDDAARIRYWRTVAQASRRLGEEFLELLESGRIRSAVQPL